MIPRNLKVGDMFIDGERKYRVTRVCGPNELGLYESEEITEKTVKKPAVEEKPIEKTDEEEKPVEKPKTTVKKTVKRTTKR